MISKLLIISILFLTTTLNAQDRLECIKQLWLKGQYKKVIDEGKKLSLEKPYLNIPALDYMIITSVCQLDENNGDGCKLFELITHDYYKDIKNDDITLLRQQYKSICETKQKLNPAILSKFSFIQIIGDQSGAHFFGSGKSYFVLKDGMERYQHGDNILETLSGYEYSTESKTKHITKADIDFFIQRRIPINDTVSVKKIAAQFASKSSIQVSEHFIFITDDKTANLKLTSKELEKSLKYFLEFYKLITPNYYIVVYISDLSSLESKITKLYKDPANKYLLGYSNIYDYSMLGWLPSPEKVGTLKHELIHLLLRSNFHSLPYWFEEGLATLYEESRFDSLNQLKGIDNWRLRLLKSNIFHLKLSDILEPKVTRDSLLNEQVKIKALDFLSYTPKNKIYFDHKREVEYGAESLFLSYLGATKDAMARYFILYMQENQQLQLFYQLLQGREQNLYNPSAYIRTNNLLLQATGLSSMDKLYNDFDIWLLKQKVAVK